MLKEQGCCFCDGSLEEKEGNNPNTCGNLLFYFILLQRPFHITSQLNVSYTEIQVETPNREIPR